MYKRGDIIFCNIPKAVGSEIEGKRPCLVISNNANNYFSPTMVVACMTSQKKPTMGTHLELTNYYDYGLSKYSTILFEQLRTVDKKSVGRRIGHIEPNIWEHYLKVSLGL